MDDLVNQLQQAADQVADIRKTRDTDMCEDAYEFQSRSLAQFHGREFKFGCVGKVQNET